MGYTIHLLLLSLMIFISCVATRTHKKTVPVPSADETGDNRNKYSSEKNGGQESASSLFSSSASSEEHGAGKTHRHSSSSEEEYGTGRTYRHLADETSSESNEGEPHQVEPPSWNDRRYKYHVTKFENQSVTFRCAAFGSPVPTVSWFKDGLEFRFRAHGTFTARGSILRLHHLKLWDSGVYTCKVTNALGSIERSFRLQVFQYTPRAPTIRKGYPENKTISVGDTVIFHCKLTGRALGEYTVSWFREKRFGYRARYLQQSRDPVIEVVKGPIETTATRSRDAFRLVIMHASAGDAGKYMCMVSNNVGTAYSSAWLLIPTAHGDSSTINGFRPPMKDKEDEKDTVGSSQEVDKSYIQGMVVAVGSSSVILIVALFLFVILAVRKVRQREDTVLEPYNLK